MSRFLIGAVAVLAMAGVAGFAGSDERSEADRAAPAQQGGGESTAATTGRKIGPAARGRIAFSDDVEDIYVINADGSDLAKVTSHAGNDFDPSWSPDGRRIAFRSERDGNNEIYVMSADGSDERNVSNYPGDDWGPAWSRDGKKIAFNSNRDGPDLHLYVVNPDGSGLERIGGDIWVEYPAWSPDGGRIAFMAQTWESGDNYEIYVMNAHGSGLRRLTNAPGSDGHPAWSPDGTRIAFDSERNSPREGELGDRIYVMNADGSRQRQLTKTFGKYPDWSPDGRHIVFSGDRLYIVNADGSKLTALATPRVARPVLPDWTR